jgi:hypothetical protein
MMMQMLRGDTRVEERKLKDEGKPEKSSLGVASLLLYATLLLLF